MVSLYAPSFEDIDIVTCTVKTHYPSRSSLLYLVAIAIYIDLSMFVVSLFHRFMLCYLDVLRSIISHKFYCRLLLLYLRHIDMLINDNDFQHY